MNEAVAIAVASPGGLGGQYHGPGTALAKVFRQAVADGGRVVALHGQGPNYRCDFGVQDCGNPLGVMQIPWALRARRYLASQRQQVALLQTATLYTAPFLAALAARSLGIPAFGRIAALGADIRVPDWRRPTSLARLRRGLLDRLDGIVALSSDIRQELLDAGMAAHKIFLIPNAVDTEVFRPASADERAALRAQLGLDDTFLVAGCGGVIPRKGVKEAVEAVGRLTARSGRRLTLLWIGPVSDNTYPEAVAALAGEMGIADRVKLVGYQSDPSPWLRAADAFVLPSANEGMPNALIEAMACGLPVLVTPVSGARDVVRGGDNGILIDRDPATISAALERLMDDPAMRVRLGEKAVRNITERYTSRQIWHMYRDMYRSCGVKL